ncbi:MAG: histidine kinase [Planctomycetes bacterium]|nr:histidine kinase [Planctomycetota bacterium]
MPAHSRPPTDFSARAGMEGFEMLMPFRIREVLLVSSLYDAFILQEDGQSLEPLLSDYNELNLRYAPRLKRVSNGHEAISLLEGHHRFDMVLITPQLGDLDPLAFADEVKEHYGPLPVVLLGYDAAMLHEIIDQRPRHPFDYVLLWSGDSRLLVGVIKLIEDRVNVLHDTARVGVRAVLLVEDSINFLSSYLPLLYTEILEQSQRVISEGVNLSHKLLRLRARPKVLLAQDLESATRLYEEHRQHLLGVITDAGVPRRRGAEEDPEAGLELLHRVREQDPLMPVMMQSSDPRFKKLAHDAGASFVDKNSPRLYQRMREFMLEGFGFGPFIFRRPDGGVIGRASSIRELEERVRDLPAESLIHHSLRNDFSTWLRARTEFALADLLEPRSVADFEDGEALRGFLAKTLNQARRDFQRGAVADFDRQTFDETISFSRIGHGSLGGKARGLAFINYLLHYQPVGSRRDVEVFVPPTVVITTELFDRFMAENDLYSIALDDTVPDQRLRQRFLSADLPRELVEELRGLVELFDGPLAVRSSSLLEDSHLQPFAGIYETLMLPNTGGPVEDRLTELCRAVKLVYASTYASKARSFIRATPFLHEEEKMAVVVQRLFGRWHGSRYYPTFAGVARSHNYYPHGPVKPEDGVACIGMGLGKLVVEGIGGLRFSPKYPRHLPDFSAVEDILENAQRHFYALDLGASTEFAEERGSPEPTRYDVSQADADGVLPLIGSVYSPEDGRISDGVSRPGARIVSFASVLKHDRFPLAELVDELLQTGAWGMGGPVEVEFAVDMESAPGKPRRLAFLQMRPLVVSHERIRIDFDGIQDRELLAVSDRALGNGRNEVIRDLLFVDPGEFERAQSRETAMAIGELNAQLEREGRPYLLVGPGRWGSSDPWLGIPVEWSQIAGARVVLETGFEGLHVQPSEGSHFFNNMTSFSVGYFTVNPHLGEGDLDLAWLRAQPAVAERPNGVRLLRFPQPLTVLIDGRTAHGAIVKPGAAVP